MYHRILIRMHMQLLDLSRANLKFYAFPPFILIGASISKIRRKMAAGIVIISWWVTQFWFPLMVPLFLDFPVVRTLKGLILISNKELHHPMYPTMKLLTVHLLGKPSDAKNFHQHLLKLSWNRGDHQQGRSRYESVLKRWHNYAISRNDDSYSPEVNTVLTFMHGMYLLVVHSYMHDMYLLELYYPVF